VNSLKANPEAAYTDLYVAIDAPRTEADLMANIKVTNYAESITGFKNVFLIKRVVNIGSSRNIRDAIGHVLSLHDRFIFTEDDNEFAPTFLKFMNNSFELYKNDPQIYMINGYNYPIKVDDIHSGDVYRFKGYCAWGAGFWRDKWNQIDWKRVFARRFVRNPKNLLRAYKLAPAYILHFLSFAWRGRFAGDTIILMNLIQNDWFTLNPVHSLVRNHGCEGSGEHRSKDERFSQQSLNAGEPDPSRLLDDSDLRLVLIRLRRYFRLEIANSLRFLISCLPFLQSLLKLIKTALRHSPS